MKEHDDLLNAQLESLIDNANELFNRLKQLAFQSIERVYQEKTNEINQFLNKQLENLRQQTQRTISQFIHQQDATNERINILTRTIHEIEK